MLMSDWLLHWIVWIFAPCANGDPQYHQFAKFYDGKNAE